ncbi:hypothetical protein ACWEOE_33220 [Amycolatopsis sp. NPDC004368]
MVNTDPLAGLGLLDPALGREPSETEWTRARASVERIMSDDRTACVRRRSRVRRPRLAAITTVAAVAAVGAVVVPSVLPSAADRAFAAWTTDPVELTSTQPLPLAEDCAQFGGGGTVTAADVLVAERRGPATQLLLHKGPAVAECVSFDSESVVGWTQVAGWPAAHPSGRTVTVDLLDSHGSGGDAFSNIAGRVGTDVAGVDVVRASGQVVHASVRDGWLTGWWPGADALDLRPIKIVVHTTDGTSATFAATDLLS